jgi:hypothetical protein
MITYAVEPWAQYLADCGELWREHYDEIAGDKARMPMRPDAARFETLEAAGQLQIVVAREAGRMVGYMLFVVTPHPHYADVLCGFEDAYFLSMPYRKGWTGVRLIRESLRCLQARGVQRWFIHTKKAKDMGRILQFLGGAHADEIYSGWIGD